MSEIHPNDRAAMWFLGGIGFVVVLIVAAIWVSHAWIAVKAMEHGYQQDDKGHWVKR